MSLKQKKYDFFFIKNKNQEQKMEEVKKISFLLPPPNITGNLHLGHAYESIIQDIIIRFKQVIEKKNIFWIVGLDHAGISTCRKIEKEKKDLKSKRKKILFTEKVWYPKALQTFQKQWKQLSLLMPFGQVNFTLEPIMQKQITEAFIKLYKDGLIYEDYSIVNFDWKTKTVISDIEIEKKTVTSFLYYLKYWTKDKKDFIFVATSRPETIFADVALFANPEDVRYKKFLNCIFENPVGRFVKLFFSRSAEKEFGTGVFKCTPGHSHQDFVLAKEHNIPIISCCDETGTLNELSGKWKGRKIWEIREELVEEIRKLGLLEKIIEYETSVPISIQSEEIIEPILSNQWFLNFPSLIEKAEKKVPNFLSKIFFFPDKFRIETQKWMNKAEAWCLSRQMWWGHSIPAWRNKKTNLSFVGEQLCCEKETNYLSSHKHHQTSKEWKKVDDVLDTWFSSSLWPIISVSLGVFPTPVFYPIDFLITGYDILFFWVLRMVVFGVYFLSEVPFKNVFFHGLIRDNSGKKMSKSLGNGIEPEEVISCYGVDALRIFFAQNHIWGVDLTYEETKIQHCWKFCQKLWSICNFVLEKKKINKKINFSELYDLY